MSRPSREIYNFRDQLEEENFDPKDEELYFDESDDTEEINIGDKWGEIEDVEE